MTVNLCQAHCSHIADDFGIEISGDPAVVAFSVTVGNVSVAVDWNQTKNNGYTAEALRASSALHPLGAVAQASQVLDNAMTVATRRMSGLVVVCEWCVSGRMGSALRLLEAVAQASHVLVDASKAVK